jgi:DNA-binding GntR family transcriptional regulator
MFRSMAAPNTAQRLRDVIEDEIAEGAFRPGERLDELVLAARYHVSRTPVREALLQLAASGLVVARPHRGTVVAAHSAEQVVEMFEVMAELEGMAGRLAARRATEDDQRRLVAAHESCRSAVTGSDPDSYYYRNELFHDAIYLGSHNDFLFEECTALRRRLKPYRRLQLRVPSRLETSFAEHDAIVRAILERDPSSAQALLRSHIVVQGDRFADLIASLRQLRRREEEEDSRPPQTRLPNSRQSRKG